MNSTKKEDMLHIDLTREEARVTHRAIVNRKCKGCPYHEECLENMFRWVATPCMEIALKLEKVIGL